MKIALLGYGKMGKAIERIASEQGHQIVVATTDSDHLTSFNGADVAIDFSVPSAAFKNCTLAIDAGVPVISGTTGWLANYDELVAYCVQNDGAFLYASNFSLGVNIFFAINEQLAKLMGDTQYTVQMQEIHHTQKLDAPSGTAITLAQEIIDNTSYTEWSLEANKENSIHIEAIREGDVKGTHNIAYSSPEDTISISHEAHSRDGFAKGAIAAAAWIIDKKGIFTMKDVLNIR
ncbi:MAG: 4-hydroxy-tetrahydrodipicolinate reductase [Gilvibacter sp.]